MNTSNDITFIILTFNEENNIVACLDSIAEIPAQIFVVDSFSTDRTVAIVQARQIRYTQHEFVDYARQRNWAQQQNPFQTGWVFHLDAGERLSEPLRDWIIHRFEAEAARYDGFLFSRRTIFLGRWIKHGGHYPTYHARLFKSSRGRCENKAYDQHFLVDGSLKKVAKADIVDTVTDNLAAFIHSHNRWSTLEAQEIYSGEATGDIQSAVHGNPIEQRRWLKSHVFGKSPLLLRGFLYFGYRYFLRLGFLDGREGLIFHFLQGLWFRFLIDAKLYELKAAAQARADE